jgi:hypothetical protein
MQAQCEANFAFSLATLPSVVYPSWINGPLRVRLDGRIAG